MSENIQKENFWSKILETYHESKQSTSERLKMPIVTFYLGLLIITYWEPLIILLFSEETIENRIDHINKLYNNKNQYYHYLLLLKTLFLGYIFSVTFPLLTQSINYLTKSAKNADRREKINQKDRIRLEEEKQALHDFKKANIKSGQLEKDEYNKSIEKLKESYEERIKSLIENNETAINNLTNTNTALKSQMKDLEDQILNFSKTNPKFGIKRNKSTLTYKEHGANIINKFNSETIKTMIINRKDNKFSFYNNNQLTEDLINLIKYFIDNELAKPIADDTLPFKRIEFNDEGLRVIDILYENIAIF